MIENKMQQGWVVYLRIRALVRGRRINKGYVGRFVKLMREVKRDVPGI